jgi:hypothetical protein
MDEPGASSFASTSAARMQAVDVLRRARKLPVGAARNDLRQLAMGLLWLDRRRLEGRGGSTISTGRVLSGPKDEVRT